MIGLLDRIGLYYRTLRYLKVKQLYYQIKYRLKKVFFNQAPIYSLTVIRAREIKLIPSIDYRNSYFAYNTFNFLNRDKKFNGNIDWNFSGFGKLWTYNLNYFDFLNQTDIDTSEATRLLDDFCKDPVWIKDGLEPYPISLRGINWIKFFVYKGINEERYNSVLYCHYLHLARNLEYHLMGNHLLENGFSLLFGAYYFCDENLYKKATSILESELKEQILSDGAHFELSPMYHQILLFRLLDCINLVKNNPWKNDSLIELLTHNASLMLGWLNAITFLNGDIPMVNDSSQHIAPSTYSIVRYAENLNISQQKMQLSSSGYRMVTSDIMELFLDVGNLGPDYIPGHAHSDTFSFILYVKSVPVIVDTGTSTYDRSGRRLIERSTASHNTVKINDQEQSEMWDIFRVGRRAKIVSIIEGNLNEISATHDGYYFQRIGHKRTWNWENRKITINDSVSGDAQLSVAYFHFHPNIHVQFRDDMIVADVISLMFSSFKSCVVYDYDFSVGFNITRKAKKVEVSFINELQTTIEINNLSGID